MLALMPIASDRLRTVTGGSTSARVFRGAMVAPRAMALWRCRRLPRWVSSSPSMMVRASTGEVTRERVALLQRADLRKARAQPVLEAGQVGDVVLVLGALHDGLDGRAARPEVGAAQGADAGDLHGGFFQPCIRSNGAVTLMG